MHNNFGEDEKDDIKERKKSVIISKKRKKNIQEKRITKERRK